MANLPSQWHSAVSIDHAVAAPGPTPHDPDLRSALPFNSAPIGQASSVSMIQLRRFADSLQVLYTWQQLLILGTILRAIDI